MIGHTLYREQVDSLSADEYYVPAFKLFPELTALAQAEGRKVDLVWQGSPIVAQALAYTAPSKYRVGAMQERLLLVLSDSMDGSPVAYADMAVSPGRRVAVCDERSPHVPLELGNLVGVSNPLYGFAVRPDKRSEELGHLLLALTYATLEAQGISALNVINDVTAPDDSPDASFYSQAATKAQSATHYARDGTTDTTTVTTTRLADTQLDLLKEALGYKLNS
jgi:hypothetical protein